MKIGIPKETREKELRVALSPDVVKSLAAAGFTIVVEKNAGTGSFFPDEYYSGNGAQIETDVQKIYSESDVILKVNAPTVQEISQMKKGSVLISFVWAATNPQVVEACEKAGITCFSMDAIPRISRAQKMDALSSQSNLAGYKTVLLGANALGKIFPMMTTAAGTIRPCKVVIMGAGVAGLQAIATAKRLGAIVMVSDIRPETKNRWNPSGKVYRSCR